MIGKSAVLVLAAACLIAPALGAMATADDALPPDTQGGRYIFNKQADGFVRLDTQTGDVSLCSQQPVGWACEVAPDDRAVFESEVARLRGENAALKKDILSRGLPLPPGIAAEPLAQNDTAQNGQITLHLPSDADIDRVVALVGQVWHRFVDAVERAQKQVLNKG